MKHLSHFLIFVIFQTQTILPINGTHSKNSITQKNPDKLLSRKRRFLVPQTSGWSITITGDLTIPIEGLGSSLSADIPITYKFDDGRYIYF